MAVSGAGGWTPSCVVTLNHRGELVTSGITQNAPPSMLVSPIEAARLLLAGTTRSVRIDMRHPGFVETQAAIETLRKSSLQQEQ